MQKKEFAPFLWRIARTVLLVDLFFAIAVGIACIMLDLWTLEAYGTVLVWVGVAVLVLTSLMASVGSLRAHRIFRHFLFPVRETCPKT